jgi:hypothetical protein
MGMNEKDIGRECPKHKSNKKHPINAVVSMISRD